MTGPVISVDDVDVHQPSLDDVFFALTGHATDADAGTDPEPSDSSPGGGTPMTATTLAPNVPLERPTRSPGLARQLLDVVVLTGRNLVHIAREPLQLSDVTVQPVLFTLLFVYVFGSGVVLPHGGATPTSRSPACSRSTSPPRRWEPPSGSAPTSTAA